MPTTLIDRYVAVALRHVSSKQRGEVDQELRAALADDIASRVADGETEERAEYAAVQEMGNPALLASNYADQHSTLIGPATYPWYKRSIIVLSLTILPIAYAIMIVIHALRGESVASIIFAPLGLVITGAMYLFTLVTLLFMAVDRMKNKDGQAWTPEDLN